MTLTTRQWYLLVHTMTITERECVVQAQFFHAFTDYRRMGDVRLVAKRVRYRPRGRNNKVRTLPAPDLRTIMRRNSAKIKHHLKTIYLGPNNNQIVRNDPVPAADTTPLSSQPSTPGSVEKVDDKKVPVGPAVGQLSSISTPEEIKLWLTSNRFDKYVEIFANFSGSDMLRMSKDDIVQICGQADGIRLFNAAHSKTISPKLKIYVCRENTSIFNAIFLSSHSCSELSQKLSDVLGVPRARDIYLQGPHSIHVQLSDEVVGHFKEETMFSVEIIKEDNSLIFLLKSKVNSL